MNNRWQTVLHRLPVLQLLSTAEAGDFNSIVCAPLKEEGEIEEEEECSFSLLGSTRLDLINGLLFRDRWQPNGRVPPPRLPPSFLLSLALSCALPFKRKKEKKVQCSAVRENQLH